MRIQFEYCVGGPILEYCIVDDNTLKINDAGYWFNPDFVEYGNVVSPVAGVIFAAYNIYRDAAGVLNMTCYQGKVAE